MADRFFCPDLPTVGSLTLEGDEAHHLARVRRIGPGTAVELFDGRGLAVRAEIRVLGRGRVELEVLPGSIPDRAPACALTLATAVPKGDRFDWLVEKATELGVARLVPIVTERSVVDPRAAKLDRLRRAIVEASKQSGRARLMELGPPTPWRDLVRDDPTPVRLLAHPGGMSRRDTPADVPRAILAIGPEGGFTDEEVATALEAGWRSIDLGPTVLRVETAALVGSALVLDRFATGRGSDVDQDHLPPDLS